MNIQYLFWFFIYTDTTQPVVPPCFCFNGGICQDGVCVYPEEWVGSLCEIGQYKPGSMGSWRHFWEPLCFGRPLILPPGLDPLSRVRSASSDVALLARWGRILHPLLSLFQISNISGEDITGFNHLWPVSSQFGLYLNSSVWRSQWLENPMQSSVASTAVSRNASV